MVAECGSLTKAAKSLYISPQALTQQINLIENEFGSKFFTRTPTGVALTQAGNIFLKRARQIIDYKNFCIHELKEARLTGQNTVRLGITSGPPSTALMSIALEFPSRYPQFVQELLPVGVSNRLKSLSTGLVDILEYPNSPVLAELGLGFTELLSAALYCRMSPDNPLASKQTLTPEDIKGRKIYVHEYNAYRMLTDSIKSLDIQEYGNSEYSSFSTQEYIDIINFCQEGGILIVLPERDYYNSTLVSVPLDAGIQMTLGLIYREEPSAAVKDFIALAKELFGREPFRPHR
jgi:DNA-binding transcriptional LysR family regulator